MNRISEKLKVLFVCTVNRMRSATAQRIFEGDDRFDVKSAGTDNNAAILINKELLEWADAIVVMEKLHRNTIRKLFPQVYQEKPIVCLYVEDDYEFMQPELIAILKLKFEDVYKRGLLTVKK